MRRSYINCFAMILIVSLAPLSFAQVSTSPSNSSSPITIDDDQMGGWYMYFWSWSQKDKSKKQGKSGQGKFGFQGDVQYRNWNVAGDLEQLLLRGGFTYQPSKTRSKFTLGYAHITTGEFGDGTDKTTENRIYQEALVPHKLGTRVFLTHRYRYEQRFTDAEKTRTRFRYALFMNIPFNQKNLKQGAIYLALYDEVFINGERDIGGGKEVLFFDRNRAYGALGYSLTDSLRTQFGYMQQTTNAWNKGQLQLSLHQAW